MNSLGTEKYICMNVVQKVDNLNLDYLLWYGMIDFGIIDYKKYSIIHYSASAISLSTTAILFFLIIKHSPQRMNVYRWLLFCNSATDALTTITILLGNFHIVGFLYFSLVGNETIALAIFILCAFLPQLINLKI